ncbi:MAG: 2,3-bisphosphoglycerate-independent phosphoglycerate mutase [Patescibacteria group bacterium]|nr:2,3-bisphosphoglycerate-independent phosphoglycerate mutase [Patescibacteria group bacterium]
MKRTFVLVILDGWGLGKKDESNPIYAAKPKTIEYIEANFPSGALQASGIAAGLPWEEEGNSEVGHLTIGAGKILYQHYPKISLAVDDGSFFENPSLKNAFLHTKKNKSSLHLIGLLTSGNVHASFKHLIALIDMAKKNNAPSLFVHIFTDGRDSPPQSAQKFLNELQNELQKRELGEIASLSGRYYAMDRDGHWDRTEQAYRLITEAKTPPQKIEQVLKKTYDRNLSDEFIEPAIIDEPHPIKSGDAVIFFNFREDRMRQITEPFLNPNFDKFPIQKINNLYVATMTEYQDKFPANAAFGKEKAESSLGKTLSENNKVQLRIAETEKYAHITYFFNGLQEKPFPNEYRVLIPSDNVAHREEHPEMRTRAITDRALIALKEGGFDFILMNYANPDIVAHTGNYDATVEAIKTVNQELERLLEAAFTNNHVVLITADHGNAEVVLDQKTGSVETKHNTNPVPFYLVAQEYKLLKPKEPGQRLRAIGLLSDVAPTILALMNISKPKEMTGQSLLDQLLF